MGERKYKSVELDNELICEISHFKLGITQQDMTFSVTN